MPGKKQASPERYAELNGGRPNTFVNYEMSEGEKKAFKAWLKDKGTDELVELINQAIEGGYNLSVKYDAYNESIAAFLTGIATNEKNKALILAGRGRTPFTAMMNTLYRHFVLFEQQWPITEGRRRPTDDE